MMPFDRFHGVLSPNWFHGLVSSFDHFETFLSPSFYSRSNPVIRCNYVSCFHRKYVWILKGEKWQSFFLERLKRKQWRFRCYFTAGLDIRITVETKNTNFSNIFHLWHVLLCDQFIKHPWSCLIASNCNLFIFITFVYDRIWRVLWY